MPAIDIVKEIAPAVARRRVRRGFRWLMQREQTFPVSMWLWNPHIYIPKDELAREHDHLLCLVFCNNSFVTSRMQRTFHEIIAEHRLSEQFLIAHGFARDEVIDECMLDFCWREGLFYLHLERDASCTPSALSPDLRRALTR